MASKSRFGATISGFGATALVASVVVSSFSSIAGAQEPSPPINKSFDVAPLEGKPSMPTPGPRDIVADFHIESTALGFDQGVGPAVGREIDYNGKRYTVADVFTANGQPCFSGGSPFAIAPAGGRLVIGLKTATPEGIILASLK
jgi:hypothetical protein